MKKKQWYFVGVYVLFIVVSMLLFQPLKGGFDDIYSMMYYFTQRMLVPVATLFGVITFVIYKKWWIGSLIGAVGGISVLYTLFVQYMDPVLILLVTTFGLIGSVTAYLVWRFIIRKVWKK